MTPSMGRQALYGCLVVGALSAESASLILNRFILSGNLIPLAVSTTQRLLTYCTSWRLQVSRLASDRTASQVN